MIQIKKSKLKEAIDMGLGSQGIWTPEIATVVFDEIQKQALSIGDISKSVCPLCDGKGRRIFKNCTPPIDEICPVCKGLG